MILHCREEDINIKKWGENSARKKREREEGEGKKEWKKSLLKCNINFLQSNKHKSF